MAYALIKLLSGGSYPTGVGADWRTQFVSAGIVAAQPTIAGEIAYPGTGSGFGIYAAYAMRTSNPFDATICIPEASVGAPVQVYLNSVLVSEVTSAGTVTCSAIGGVNVFEVVRPQAPLVVMPAGPFIDPTGQTGRWMSLYPSGSDPFSSGGSSGGRGLPIAESAPHTL
ncbi:MAG TPA: hypothetical protein VHE55_11125 [Fimbriimonadaceae bacterium]|nr:hypothetical protein [Fimbriimonadaceae bacterium]